MRDNWISGVCGISAAILVIYSLVTIGMDVGSILEVNSGNSRPENLLGLQDKNIKRALAKMETAEPFELPATMKTPFRIAGYVKTPQRRVPSGPRYQRVTLRLKGILAKDNSLAIIENENGKSFICKKGDIIGEQEVHEINQGEVIMRDKLGTYRIAVSEK